jgi:hypothetical protein
MKKKLYFSNLDTDIEHYIEIHNGKLRKYVGLNSTTLFIASFSTVKSIDIDKSAILNLDIKSDFKLTKLNSYDKKEIKTEANYKIESHEINQYVFGDAFIKLNLFEKILIDYSKKETVFHEIKFKQLIVIGLFVTLPIGLLIVYLGNPNILQKNSPNPNLKITSQDSINAIQKATTISTKTIKLERDSLSRK